MFNIQNFSQGQGAGKFVLPLGEDESPRIETDVTAGQKDFAVDPFAKADLLRLLQEYLTDLTPDSWDADRLKEFGQFFAVTSKAAKLSFLNKEDVDILTLQFESARINYLMSKPASNFSFADLQMLDQLDMQFRFTVKRSVGVQGQVMNERMAQVAQVVQSITMGGGQHGGGSDKPGLLRRITHLI